MQHNFAVTVTILSDNIAVIYIPTNWLAVINYNYSGVFSIPVISKYRVSRLTMKCTKISETIGDTPLAK